MKMHSKGYMMPRKQADLHPWYDHLLANGWTQKPEPSSIRGLSDLVERIVQEQPYTYREASLKKVTEDARAGESCRVEMSGERSKSYERIYKTTMDLVRIASPELADAMSKPGLVESLDYAFVEALAIEGDVEYEVLLVLSFKENRHRPIITKIVTERTRRQAESKLPERYQPAQYSKAAA